VAKRAGIDGSSELELNGLNSPSNVASLLPGSAAMLARQRIDEMRRTHALDSVANPFFYYSGHEQEFQLESNPAPSDSQAPTMELKGLMGGQTPLAIIDRKMYRVGDTIENGWVLTKINADARTIVVRGPNGDEVTISAANP
jgi:hypothetical protein